MRGMAIVSAAIAAVLVSVWGIFGVKETITIQQAILMGTVFAAGLICASNIEK